MAKKPKVYKPAAKQTKIIQLKGAAHPSPIKLSNFFGDNIVNYITDSERIVYDGFIENVRRDIKKQKEPVSFEMAGPREKIFFDPAKVRAGIVTCGGLCPGINNVVRGIVRALFGLYQIRDVLGFRYGLEGLVPQFQHPVQILNPDFVDRVHECGGSFLGSSRGPQDPATVVDYLLAHKIDVLFCVGGDGTFRAAQTIVDEIDRRRLPISVVCVPKTIDNDISFIEKTFGFETAVSEAAKVIKAAHVEATGARNGVGVVKLMGRHSGFIAATSVLASNDVDFVLIPEVPFVFEGDKGLLANVESCVAANGHAVIVVAEGAGQELFPASSAQRDASGNVKLQDIGRYVSERVTKHFADKKIHLNLKYIDPSYVIRSAPANAQDAIFCARLAQNAVHAAMAGKTGVVIGYWHNFFTHIPIALATAVRKQIHPESKLWLDVLAETHQPVTLINRQSEILHFDAYKKAS